MKRILFGLAIVSVLAVFPLSVPEASAHDNSPCGHANSQGHQVCQMWRGNVPVVNSDWKTVGHLWSATGNWFICQEQAASYHLPGTSYTNNWWAYTESDDGGWGWVSEVYFKGGNNNERDAGLAHC